MARTRVTPGDWLRSINACKGGVDWLGNRSVYFAWRYCPHADYLCWLFGALDYHIGVLGAVSIARHMTSGVWFDRRLESVYDDLYRWAGGGRHDPLMIRRNAHRAQTELNEHPLAKALTWAAVCATANTPALCGEAASLSCVASIESVAVKESERFRCDSLSLSKECADVLRATVPVASVEQAWKRVLRGLK